MARSADALKRRAQKRGRLLEEQQSADANDAARERNNKRLATEKGQEVNKALTEPGAWKCPSCGNHNFSSRYICNSKTCNESKPESAIRASQASRSGGLGPKSWTSTRPPPHKKPKRHDPETSKFIDWSKPQASASQIEHNQLLRQRLKGKDPTLTGEELERAQILVARDARKQQKKKEKPTKRERKQQRLEKQNINTSGSSVGEEPPDNAKDEDEEKSQIERHQAPKMSKKEQQKAKKELLKHLEETKGEGMSQEEVKRAKELQNRKANKALMKKFEMSGGKGMTEDEKLRAQKLLARKERKQMRRVQEGQRQREQHRAQ